MIARDVLAEVDDEMTEVVFLAGADGTVGEEHELVVLHEAADGMVRVDPGFHARGGVELGARRPQLDETREGSRSSAATSGPDILSVYEEPLRIAELPD